MRALGVQQEHGSLEGIDHGGEVARVPWWNWQEGTGRGKTRGKLLRSLPCVDWKQQLARGGPVAGVFDEDGLRFRRGLGDDSVRSSSNWRAIPCVKMKSTMAITVDNSVELEDVDDHAASIYGDGGVLFVVGFVLGVRGRDSGEGEWRRG